MGSEDKSLGIVFCVIIATAAVMYVVKSQEPPTVGEAQQNLQLAEQKCKDWQEELTEHPEYYKTTEIENTEKKTKRLCTDAIHDAELDLEGATIRAEKAQKQESSKEQSVPSATDTYVTHDAVGNVCRPSQRVQDAQGRWLCPTK
jgi:hypothetical protein